MAKNFRDMVDALLQAHLAVENERYTMARIAPTLSVADYPSDYFKSQQKLHDSYRDVEAYVVDLRSRVEQAEQANRVLCERLGVLTAGAARINRKDRVLTLSMKVDEIALRTAGLDMLNASFLKMRQEYEHAVDSEQAAP